MVTTEFGMVIDVKFEQPTNAYAIILVTVLGITYELFSDADGYNQIVVFALLNNTPFSDEKFGLLSATVMLVRLAPVLLNEVV